MKNKTFNPLDTPVAAHTGFSKTCAVVAYLTLLGFIIAFFMNLEPKNKFVYFHLRQSLGLQTLFYAFGALLGIAPSLYAGYGFLLCFSILWIFAFSSALLGKEQQLPFIGGLLQRVFSFMK